MVVCKELILSCYSFNEWEPVQFSRLDINQIRFLKRAFSVLDQKKNLSEEICLVGNASSLIEKKIGAEIDSFETVIRLNKGYPKNTEAQGKKTTLLGLSCPLSFLKYRWYYGKPAVMWMTPSRDRIPKWIPKQEQFSFYSLDRWEALSEALGGKRPSTGMMMIDYLCGEVKPSRLKIVGFDFKATNTLYSDALKPGPHDWDAERDHVFEIVGEGARQGRDWQILR